MRVELAAVVSLIIGVFSSTVMSFLGGGLAEYAAALSLASFPFIIFSGLCLILFVRFLLMKFGNHTPIGFVVAGIFSACLIGVLVLTYGDWYAGLSIAVGVIVMFISFAKLQPQPRAKNA
jgi:hypothetical protein